MTDSAARFDPLIAGICAIFDEGSIPLYRPVFEGKEREYLVACIDSNFVSSVGARVTEFDERIAAFTGVAHAVATVNGTVALQVALQLAGVFGALRGAAGGRGLQPRQRPAAGGWRPVGPAPL